MEINIANFYGYLLILMGLLLALYYQYKSITTPLSKPKDGISSLKWSQFAWFSFFSLTLMGTIIIFLDIFDQNIVNFRATWLVCPSSITTSYCSNGYTIFLDLLLIVFCFIRLYVIITRIGTSKYSTTEGKLTFKPAENIFELIVYLFGFRHFSIIFSFILLFIGVSFALVFLYLILQSYLIYVIVRKGVPN